MKKYFKKWLIMVCHVGWCVSWGQPLVTVLQFAEHPALDAARMGILEAFRQRHVTPTVQVRNAEGNLALCAQIAQQQASMHPNFMIAIATPAAQTLLKTIKPPSILAFIAVTDPEKAGLTGKINVIGIADAAPVELLLDAMQRRYPKCRRIGVVFNPSEINAMVTTQKMRQSANKRHLQVLSANVVHVRDIPIALQYILPQVDVLYMPIDNLLVSAVNTVVAIANNHHVPIIANDPTLLNKGIAIAVGSDYFNMGIRLGHVIADALTQPKPH
jgi:putative tryptophan/tyrosine transport system substrate-binding protein